MVRGFVRTPTEKMVLRAGALAIDDDLIAELNDLPAECLHIIFDHLTLKHLYRLSIQSGGLEVIARDYVSKIFKGKHINITKNQNDCLVFDEPFALYFLDSVQNITIHGRSSELISILGREDYAQLKPKTIVFRDLSSIGEEPTSNVVEDSVKTTMELVNSTKFVVNRFNGKVFDNVLKHAKNLRKLKIISTSPKVDHHASYKSKWCFWKYPYLESIQWDSGINNKRHFRYLLRHNPGIKTMTFTRKIPEALEFIEKNNLKLKSLRLDLSSTGAKDITSICEELNRLVYKRTYEKLHLTFGNKHVNHIGDIASLEALDSIEFSGVLHPSIARLPTLKELTVASLGNRTSVLMQLSLLEKLHIREASIDCIRPLLGSLKNLTEIVITSVQRGRLPDIDDLINQRALLTGASSLQLFIEEWAYINLKKYSVTDHLIQIRRIESFQSSD